MLAAQRRVTRVASTLIGVKGASSCSAGHFEAGAAPVVILLITVSFVCISPQPAIPHATTSKTVPSISVPLTGPDLAGVAGGNGREPGFELS
jgi:hypothetical protein